jgi:hypothetical protein
MSAATKPVTEAPAAAGMRDAATAVSPRTVTRLTKDSLDVISVSSEDEMHHTPASTYAASAAASAGAAGAAAKEPEAARGVGWRWRGCRSWWTCSLGRRWVEGLCVLYGVHHVMYVPEHIRWEGGSPVAPEFMWTCWLGRRWVGVAFDMPCSTSAVQLQGLPEQVCCGACITPSCGRCTVRVPPVECGQTHCAHNAHCLTASAWHAGMWAHSLKVGCCNMLPAGVLSAGCLLGRLHHLLRHL